MKENIQNAAYVATLLLALNSQIAFSADDLSQALAKAGKLIDSGKPKPAALILRQVIRTNPNNAEAHMQLGAALASLAVNEKYDEAIAEEELAIKLDPKSSGARRILGMIYANQKKYDQSIALLNEACKLNPTSFAAQRDLSKAYVSAGKSDDAIVALKKAIEIKPDNVSAHSKLATLLAKKGDTADAIKEASKAVELGGKRAEPHLLLANIKLDSGDSAGAIEPFKEAIAANGYDSLGCLNPLTAASAMSGLGWALAADKNASRETLTEAVRYQKKAMKAYPSFLTAYIRTAELLARQEKPKEAEAMYKSIFKASQYQPTVGISYGKFLNNTHRPEEARVILKKVLEVSPENKLAAEELTKLSPAKTQ